MGSVVADPNEEGFSEFRTVSRIWVQHTQTT